LLALIDKSGNLVSSGNWSPCQ